MNKRPRSITILSWLFIVTGSIGFCYHALSAFKSGVAERPAELALILILRILAAIGGVFALRGRNWARWLLTVWLGYHVFLSYFHSPVELAVHGLFFVVLAYFFFCPKASAYFRGSKTEGPKSSTAGEQSP